MRIRATGVALVIAAAASPAAWASGPEDTLPRSLNEWGGEVPRKQDDEREWRESFTFIRKAPQPGDGKHGRPLFDLDHMEGGIWGGVVHFSSAFESEAPEVCGTLSLRLPMPLIPLQDRWGVFVQWTYSEIDRDLPYYYDHQYDQWWMLGGGADFLLLRNNLLLIRFQAGACWAQFGDIDGLESGPGILAGGYLGFHWVRGDYRFTFGYQPQFAFDGDDYMIFNQVGFQFDF
jgi:hypothetical protein